MAETICPHCGTEIDDALEGVDMGGRVFCSDECAESYDDEEEDDDDEDDDEDEEEEEDEEEDEDEY